VAIECRIVERSVSALRHDSGVGGGGGRRVREEHNSGRILAGDPIRTGLIGRSGITGTNQNRISDK
jgi:hypothetical protein